MPQTDTGILLVVGAVFFLIGLLGGKLEIKDIKITTPTGKIIRIILGVIGLIMMGIAISQFIFPFAPTQSTVTPTLVVEETESKPEISLQQSESTSTYTPPPTNTPSPTNTPRPTPMPTATIDADPTVYDNFNNPAFDGTFNSNLWTTELASLDTAQIIQNNGQLLLAETAQAPSEGFIMIPRNWKEGSLKFYEIKMMLNSETEGANGSITINVHSPNIPGGWTEFGIDQNNGVTPNIFAATGVEKLAGLDAKYDTWYTLRIEFNEQQRTLSYVVNDQLLTRYQISDNDEINGITLQLWHQEGTSIKAFVDEVRIWQ